MPSVYVLATDHGTHPADAWSGLISRVVFPISRNIAPEKRQSAERAQADIAAGLTGFLDGILLHERAQLTRGLVTGASPFDGDQYVDAALSLIYAVTDATDWAQYMRSNDGVLRLELAKQIVSMQDVERSHHRNNGGTS